jgi:hypothetical protein
MQTQRLVFSLRGAAGYLSGPAALAKASDAPSKVCALVFEGAAIEDADLLGLPHLPSLRCLDLDSTRVTDACLKAVTRMPALEELWLECTSVSDTGLASLSVCGSLRFVSVAYTAVTEAGVIALKAALPTIEIST